MQKYKIMKKIINILEFGKSDFKTAYSFELINFSIC